MGKMKEAVIQDLTEPMKMLKNFRIRWMFKYQSYGCATKFRQSSSVKYLILGVMIGVCTMAVLQLTRCSVSSSFWTKNQLLEWNTHPLLLIWHHMSCGCLKK
jgi:hypothetical protein